MIAIEAPEPAMADRYRSVTVRTRDIARLVTAITVWRNSACWERQGTRGQLDP